MFWHNKQETLHVQVHKPKHIPTSHIEFQTKMLHIMQKIKIKITKNQGKQKPISFFHPSIFPFTAALVPDALVSLRQRRAIKLSVESSVHTYRIKQCNLKLVLFLCFRRGNNALNVVTKQMPEQRNLNTVECS